VLVINLYRFCVTLSNNNIYLSFFTFAYDVTTPIYCHRGPEDSFLNFLYLSSWHALRIIVLMQDSNLQPLDYQSNDLKSEHTRFNDFLNFEEVFGGTEL